MSKKLSALVLDDGRAGNFNQSVALAEKANMNVQTLPVSFNWKALLPHDKFPTICDITTTETRQTLHDITLPDIVISAGRRLGTVARTLKKQQGDKAANTRFIHLMHPGKYWQSFDLLGIPLHDNPPAHKSVITTQATPHRLTIDSLQEAGAELLPQLELLPRPFIGVIVGGDTRHGAFSVKAATLLAQKLNAHANAIGGSILLTTSRRTSYDAMEALRSNITAPCYFYDWHDMEGEENPYMGILALSNYLVLTGDSMSMISEAAFTGTPLYIFDQGAHISEKHRLFHQQLYHSNHARPLEDTLDSFSGSAIDSAAEMIIELKRLMKKS